ncbi:MAG: methyltransferase domain-containing protein [Planctomycetota bacterium]
MGRFPLRTHKIDTARGVLKIRAPRSMEEMLLRDGEDRRRALSGDLPHWMKVWPASVAAARRLCRGPDLDGKVVWDLGCGLGTAGLGAAKAGASVHLLDRSAEALQFAASQFELAGLPAPEATVFDWSQDSLPDGPCDLCLLCDLAYEWKHLVSLLRIIDELHARRSTIQVFDPERPTANDLYRVLVDRGANCATESVAFGGERVLHRVATLVAPSRGSSSNSSPIA